jgi:three-Cys-motif partner protein
MARYVWDSDTIPTIDVHSIKKHDVLREYLLQYIRILGGTRIHVDHLDITFVDAFSGGGLYQRRDGTLHEGSPLIFLRAAEEATFHIQQEKQFSLNAHYIFLDEKQQCIDFLKNTLAERGYGSRVDKDIFFSAVVLRTRLIA